MKRIWVLAFLLAPLGCSSLSTGDRPQHLNVAVEWVKPTLPKNYTGPRTQNPMSPVLTETLVIQGNSVSGIGAYLRENGQRQWWLPIDGGISGGAAAINDLVFFGASDGFFYAVNINTGTVEWSVPIRSESLSAPRLDEGILYFLSGINTLYALDATNGTQKWIYTRPDPSGFSIRGGSTPLVHDGVVYGGFSDGHLVALDKKSGTVIWEKVLNQNKKFRDVDSSPIVDGQSLFIAGFDDAVYALDLKSGQVRWSFPQGGFGSMSQDSESIYVATTDNSIVSLNKQTGKSNWKYAFKSGISAGPELVDSLVVSSLSSGPLVFLDRKTGKNIAQYATGLGSFSVPVLDRAKNQLYFMSRGAHLYSMNFQWKTGNRPFPNLHGQNQSGQSKE